MGSFIFSNISAFEVSLLEQKVKSTKFPRGNYQPILTRQKQCINYLNRLSIRELVVNYWEHWFVFSSSVFEVRITPCWLVIQFTFSQFSILLTWSFLSHLILQKDLEDDPPLEEALNSAYFGHIRGKRTVGISLKSLSRIAHLCQTLDTVWSIQVTGY